MKKTTFFDYLKIGFLLASAAVFAVSCDNDDDDTAPESETYTINEIGGSGISGTAEFEKISNTTTRITVTLSGTEDGDTHPMHIHENSAAEGGPIAIPLTAVDGATGVSVTDVTETNGGTAVTYEDLLEFDGYINVHLSQTELATIIAQGDIGQNAD